ncbi:hypothetical protein OP10G_2799 [Fimbriimonas ginsengisoli Gsoil 348]|uniref:Uncharacterized protein n=1 Tax=Fimbriimonas ginsengisoli Gsoil 348 TaxID=661478 RepID=A0A068NS49_FIMGI|nr:hypothetical protein OP10G_2799 [Fimbriimonas ginsengisoli Gsoil 348]
MPGGDYSSAAAINGRGDVVGLCSTGKTLVEGLLRDTRAVLWRDGKAIDLIGKSQSSPAAFAVNDLDQVLIQPQYIGASRPGSIPPPMPYVVLWEVGKTRLWKDPSQFRPQAINNHGDLAGFSGGFAQTLIGEKIESLIPPVDKAQAWGWSINDAGMVGGTFQVGVTSRGFITTGGKLLDPVPETTECFGGFRVSPIGHAAEAARTSSRSTYLFLWKEGAVQNLVPLGRYGSVSGINSKDQIVGNANGLPFLFSQGRLFHMGEVVHDKRMVVETVTGINEAGQISASARIGNRYHAVRLDPI